MKARRSTGWRIRLWLVTVAMAVGGAGHGMAGQSGDDVATTGPKAAPTAVEGTADGPAEGIRVHGRWTVEVRDPDGTVVSRQEFDNALVSSGATALVEVLGRTKSVGNWQIVAQSLSGQEVCESTPGTPFPQCHILEASDPEVGDELYFFGTLTVAVTATPSLNLSGYVTAQRNGSIAAVVAVMELCLGSTAPDSCVGAGLPILDSMSWFTQTTLPSPVAVLTGQQVYVSVVISFS